MYLSIGKPTLKTMTLFTHQFCDENYVLNRLRELGDICSLSAYLQLFNDAANNSEYTALIVLRGTSITTVFGPRIEPSIS